MLASILLGLAWLQRCSDRNELRSVLSAAGSMEWWRGTSPCRERVEIGRLAVSNCFPDGGYM